MQSSFVLRPSRNCSVGATRHLGDRETVSRVFTDGADEGSQPGSSLHPATVTARANLATVTGEATINPRPGTNREAPMLRRLGDEQTFVSATL